MKTKILIVLIITIVLGGGGFFIWKNSFLTKIEKPAVKEEIKKEIEVPPVVEEVAPERLLGPGEEEGEIERLPQEEKREEALTLTEIKFEWKKEEGIRITDGSVPYAYKLADGRIRLYYCGAGGILSAISSDGLNFEKEPGIRITPVALTGNPEWMVCDPTIVNLPADGKIRMYYKGANGSGGPGQAIHNIFSAISSDGLNFQKEGLRIDSTKTGDRGWASVPEVVLLPDGRIRIYYVSGDFEALGGTMSAISSDGLNFKKEAGARVKIMVDPAVTILPDGRYLLLAVSLPPPPGGPPVFGPPPGIYSFFSNDGLTFSNPQPVLLEEGVYDPTIISLGSDTYRVFYGKDMRGQEGIRGVVTKSFIGRLR